MLLSFLPLSYIVVLIRELANILFSTLASTLEFFQIAQLLSNIDIDINNNIIRERSAFSSRISSRESSTYSIALLSPYYERIEI